jgi:hypothetical protein
MNPEDTKCRTCGKRTDDFFGPDDPLTCRCGNQAKVADPTVPWVLNHNDKRFLRGAGIKVEE